MSFHGCDTWYLYDCVLLPLDYLQGKKMAVKQCQYDLYFQLKDFYNNQKERMLQNSPIKAINQGKSWHLHDLRLRKAKILLLFTAAGNILASKVNCAEKEK